MATALWPEIARIPHPRRRLPLVGDVLSVSPATPLQGSVALARELGPIYHRRLFGHELVFVSGAELAVDLMDESRFAKHVVMAVRNLRSVAGDALFTAYGHEPNWRRAHDILAPGFTREAMRRYHPVMVAQAERLTDVWDRHAAAGTAVDVTGDMTKLTLETIARAGFGHDFGSFEREEPHPFVTAMIATLRSAQARRVALPLVGRAVARAAERRAAAPLAYLRGVVDAVVAERTSSGDTGTDDLLGLMLNSAQPSTGERLDPANIRNQILTFLVAGHETTSGALSFALHHLARHPAALARAREEVDRVWEGPGAPAYEQVGKARYVRRVLDESLRLWPTAPAIARAARHDTVLAGRHPMRAGAWALVLLPALHRDPVWGPEPDAFDPDRFLPERVRARPAHVYKPFGTGERACIGRQFALHEATLVLGLLLRRYRLHDDPGYHLRVSERLTLMPEGFALTLSRR
ncbi:cytochrome P450 [Streptomyces sp. SBT349]|uniref:cytochrome P450 n=1 Tax=Streptomyces sp. SBT349 TaxID=1580539 RepID=UPI00066C3EE2|nr:cytochrome P450 [Streptomyces sp. SBT349]